MKVNFDFTKSEYEHLKEELMLNEEMAKILEMKIKGYSITKISMDLNMSERNVNKKVKKTKRKDNESFITLFFCAFFVP